MLVWTALSWIGEGGEIFTKTFLKGSVDHVIYRNYLVNRSSPIILLYGLQGGYLLPPLGIVKLVISLRPCFCLTQLSGYSELEQMCL